MRINVVPVKALSDIHLRAEYREIKMLIPSYRRSLMSKNGINYGLIAKDYTLNKGHGYFFYDKFKFIEERFRQIVEEMEERLFKINLYKLNLDDIALNGFNDYVPTKNAIFINASRIFERMAANPKVHLYRGNSVHSEFWQNIYKMNNILTEDELSIINQKIIEKIDNGTIYDYKKGKHVVNNSTY